MKSYEIFWDDLNMDAQLRLHHLYHENIHLAPLAIFDIEDADITPEDYDGPTTEITLYYRDGANYKYTEKFRVPTAKLEETRRVRGDAFYEQDDALITYDYDLGIDRETFHDTLGTNYNDDYDHNFVIIQEVDGKPNTPPITTVHSSHGTFTFNRETGTVLDTDNLEDSFGEMPKKIDIGEWYRYYPDEKELPIDIDILDLGYEDVNGKYEPAEDSWRMERKQLQIEEG